MTVLHSEPSILVARLQVPALSLSLVTAHGPPRARTALDREQWWQKFARICKSVDNGQDWLLFLDANARVGEVVSEAIGPWQADPQDLAGSRLHELLKDLRLHLPSTFQEFMYGPGGTLFVKRNQALARSDYVATPCCWKQQQQAAWVSSKVSSGHRGLDHWAAVVSVSRVSFTGRGKKARDPCIDPAALRDPRNQTEIESVIAATPFCGWQVNVHEHVATVVGHLQRELCARFPLTARRPRASYLSEETFALHQSLVVIRSSLKRRNWALRCTLLRCAFVAWRTFRTDVTFSDVYCGRWLRDLHCHIAMDVHRLSCMGDVLRAACKTDRATYVSRLADELRDAPAVEVSSVVKQLVKPKRFRRSGPQQLPRLKKADGQLCNTPAEVKVRWRQYFSEIEAGVQQDPSALVAECLRQQQARGPAIHVPGDQLPTLQELEEAFRGVQGRKASGPDRVPPDVCAPLAIVFWPVLLKTLLYTAEAAGCKGVTLHHIPKGKGDLADCSASRAITVQSCFSKALQRAIRPLLVSKVEEQAPAMMWGGRCGQSALFGCFAVRSFMRASRRDGASVATIFFDIASAYYAVIRELLVGKEDGEVSVEELAQGLKLTSAEMQAVASRIEAELVLAEAGSPFLSRRWGQLPGLFWPVMMP